MRLFASLLVWLLALSPSLAEQVTFAPVPGPNYSGIANIATAASGQSQALFMGFRAGATFPFSSTDTWGSIGIGSNALSSLTTTGAEDTAVGGMSQQFETGSLNTSFGITAISQDTSTNNNTMVGVDSMRDAISSSGSNTGVGVHAAAHGQPDRVVAIGVNSTNGNSGGVLIGGSKTTNDIITITLSASGSTPGSVTGLPQSINRTVQAGDTIASIAAALAAAWSTSAVKGPTFFVSADSTSFSDGTAVVSFYFTGTTTTGWAITISSSCSGTCTETLTNLPGSNFSSSVAVGAFSLFGPGANGTLSGETAVGDSACKNLVSGLRNTCIGSSSGIVATTGNNNAMLGYNSGVILTTGGSNTLVGAFAGAKLTTGSSNVLIGQNVGGATLATGSGNILIGFNTLCDTASSNTGNTIAICGSPGPVVSCTGTGTLSTAPCAVSGTFAESGITTDSGQTATATVCEDTTTHVFYFGSGAAGICKGTSSLRFKENVEPLGHGLDDLMRLDTISYNYKPNIGLDPSRRLYGFSAEQMQDVLPELVYSDAQGPTSIDWAGVVPILVHAVQEQQREIEQLRAGR